MKEQRPSTSHRDKRDDGGEAADDGAVTYHNSASHDNGDTVAPIFSSERMKFVCSFEFGERIPQGSVPRACSLNVTRFKLLQPLELDPTRAEFLKAQRNSVNLAFTIEGKRGTVRTSDFELDSHHKLDARTAVSIVIQYAHTFHGDNVLRISLERKKRYKHRPIKGYKTIGRALVNLSEILQHPFQGDITIPSKVDGTPVATITLDCLKSLPIDDQELGEGIIDSDDSDTAGSENEAAAEAYENPTRSRRLFKPKRLKFRRYTVGQPGDEGHGQDDDYDTGQQRKKRLLKLLKALKTKRGRRGRRRPPSAYSGDPADDHDDVVPDADEDDEDVIEELDEIELLEMLRMGDVGSLYSDEDSLSDDDTVRGQEHRQLPKLRRFFASASRDLDPLHLARHDGEHDHHDVEHNGGTHVSGVVSSSSSTTSPAARPTAQIRERRASSQSPTFSSSPIALRSGQKGSPSTSPLRGQAGDPSYNGVNGSEWRHEPTRRERSYSGGNIIGAGTSGEDRTDGSATLQPADAGRLSTDASSKSPERQNRRGRFRRMSSLPSGMEPTGDHTKAVPATASDVHSDTEGYNSIQTLSTSPERQESAVSDAATPRRKKQPQGQANETLDLFMASLPPAEQQADRALEARCTTVFLFDAEDRVSLSIAAALGSSPRTVAADSLLRQAFDPASLLVAEHAQVDKLLRRLYKGFADQFGSDSRRDGRRASPKSQGTLSVVIVGGNAHIHAVLACHCGTPISSLSKPGERLSLGLSLSERPRLRYFVVPTLEDNEMANSLAANDPTYRALFTGMSWMGTVSSAASFDTVALQTLFERIQHYTSDAGRTAEFGVGEVLVTWDRVTDTQSFQALLPFISNVRIGTLSETHDILTRANKSGGGGASLKQGSTDGASSTSAGPTSTSKIFDIQLDYWLAEGPSSSTRSGQQDTAQLSSSRDTTLASSASAGGHKSDRRKDKDDNHFSIKTGFKFFSASLTQSNAGQDEQAQPCLSLFALLRDKQRLGGLNLKLLSLNEGMRRAARSGMSISEATVTKILCHSTDKKQTLTIYVDGTPFPDVKFLAVNPRLPGASKLCFPVAMFAGAPMVMSRPISPMSPQSRSQTTSPVLMAVRERERRLSESDASDGSTGRGKRSARYSDDMTLYSNV